MCGCGKVRVPAFLQKQKQQMMAAEKKGAVKYFEDGKQRPASTANPTIETNLKSKNTWWPGTEFTSQGYSDFQETLLDPQGKPIETVEHGMINPDTTLEVDPKNFKTLKKQRRGGDVSIYGRRNYSADTPSFFNFGGLTNKTNINNNWLNKYKS